MSSLVPHPDVSLSQFHDLFDTGLLEYSQKIGKDITTDPLTARLLYSSDAALEILQEQVHAFNQCWNGDWKVQLMRRLKPTIDILFGLSTSGVFGEGIGLVKAEQGNTLCGSSSPSTLQRFPPAKAIFAGVGLLLAVYLCQPVSACLRYRNSKFQRLLRESALVMMHCLIFSNVSNITLAVSKSSPSSTLP